MKKQTLLVILVLMCTCAWGAEDGVGALAGYQGGVMSDVMVAGPTGIIGHDLSLLFGSLGPATHPYQDAGYGYSFMTGPNSNPASLSGYSEGASFGEGGNFDAYDNTAAWCTKVCHFSGNWVWSKLTETVLSNGTYVYTLTGEMTGTYQTDIEQRACRAFVTIPVFDETTPIFQGMTSLAYGGLQIIYQPN